MDSAVSFSAANPPPADLGRLLRQRREAAGLSRTDVAKRAGISASTLKLRSVPQKW